MLVLVDCAGSERKKDLIKQTFGPPPGLCHYAPTWYMFRLKIKLKLKTITLLGAGFKDFLFSPLPREMIQFDYSIFRWIEATN